MQLWDAPELDLALLVGLTQKTRKTMNKPKEYLQDPDEQMEAIAFTCSEPVQANNQAKATEKCEKLANQYNLHLEGVEKRAAKWFDCLFRGK